MGTIPAMGLKPGIMDEAAVVEEEATIPGMDVAVCCWNCIVDEGTVVEASDTEEEGKFISTPTICWFNSCC